MKTQAQLEDEISRELKSTEYRVYKKVRLKVLQMVDLMLEREELPSDYWKEEISGFEYILDASPLIIKNLRHHCYHITGLRQYEYRRHHVRNKTRLEERYKHLKRNDPLGLFVPESPLLGGFGFKDDGLMYNVDTIKYYESILTLYHCGFLDQYCKGGERKVVLEIGGGWGGFAYQFKTLFPDITYIIIDLPQTLLFSAVYLQVLFPKAKCLIYNKPNDAIIDKKYDFIFLPHFALPELRTSLDFTINTVAFQEMTKEQVDIYCNKVYQLGCPKIYSYNRYQNLNNLSLGVLTTIIEKYYRLELFEASFLQKTKSGVKKEVNFMQMIKRYLRKNIFSKRVYVFLLKIKTGSLLYKTRQLILDISII